MTTQPLPARRDERRRQPKASWLVALRWLILGVLLTVATYSVGGLVAQVVVGAAGGGLLWLVGGAGVGVAVSVARRLPRRARACFVTGVVTPLVLFGLFLLWLVWALSHWEF